MTPGSTELTTGVAKSDELPEVRDLLLSFARREAAARGGAALLSELLGADPEGVTTELLSEKSCAYLIVRSGELACGLALIEHGGLFGGGLHADGSRGPATLALLSVEPEFRAGIAGELLLEAARAWAAAAGHSGLDVAVLAGSRWTKALLERQGYRARLLVMDRPEG